MKKEVSEFISSYMIGISLKTISFIPLFVKIQRYMISHGIEDCVKMRNIMSLCIPLYYLNEEWMMDEKNKIDVRFSGVSYLVDGAKNRIAYLVPKEDNISSLAEVLSGRFDDKYYDLNNQYYIPHVSLFKILDGGVYDEHSVEIEGIINNFLKDNNDVDFYDGFCLYVVNYNYRPPMIIPIN